MNEQHLKEQPLKEEILNILRVLSSNSGLTQRDLSAHMDVSLGKTNYLLKSLVRDGLIKIKNFASGDQKLKKISYVLTKKGFKAQLRLTYYYLKIKEKEYLTLKKEIEEVQNVK